MEDQDDVEGVEFCAGHGERQPDEDGVEDDAELQDEDGRHLRREIVPTVVAADVPKVILPGNLAGASRGG